MAYEVKSAGLAGRSPYRLRHPCSDNHMQNLMLEGSKADSRSSSTHQCRASEQISQTIHRLKHTTAGLMSTGIRQALTCVQIDAPNPAEHSALS